ncbi:MAG: aromatic amino acid hydroxylase [Flavobacteriales bacterium]
MEGIDFNSNTIIKRLPKHLRQWVVLQNYDHYTAQNQAVWRYVMRKSVHFLSQFAHPSYIEGLAKAGISMDEIPRMQGMNRILKDIGWAAVAVDGFIPPNAFMEFQSYNVLVITLDIRTIQHILYTPAPDIIHEASGHAPIISNPEYAEYLRRFGELGAKAISSIKDQELFDAIRHLSILKENPTSTEKKIKQAEQKVQLCNDQMGPPSEMSRLRNLHWWTVEYGLIGSLKDPKIYGAGLLSSIGESKWCMSDKVLKTPYSLSAADVSFDITKPQEQLFVTPNFTHLSKVLEKFADEMALRKGGVYGIKKLIDSQGLGTIKLSTGIQVSAIFDILIEGENENPIYFKTKGPTALSFRNKELLGHGKIKHPEGFGSPVGKLKGVKLAIEEMTPKDLEHFGIIEGQTVSLYFESGVNVVGEIITGKRNLQGKIILISFKNCTVTYKNQKLFLPQWGTYDMVVGEHVVSAFAGVADPECFDLEDSVKPLENTKIAYSLKDQKLYELYQNVRDIRENIKFDLKQVQSIFDLVTLEYPDDWLLCLELYELVAKHETVFKSKVLDYLIEQSKKKEYTSLIEEGIAIVDMG